MDPMVSVISCGDHKSWHPFTCNWSSSKRGKSSSALICWEGRVEKAKDDVGPLCHERSILYQIHQAPSPEGWESVGSSASYWFPYRQTRRASGGGSDTIYIHIGLIRIMDKQADVMSESFLNDLPWLTFCGSCDLVDGFCFELDPNPICTCHFLSKIWHSYLMSWGCKAVAATVNSPLSSGGSSAENLTIL